MSQKYDYINQPSIDTLRIFQRSCDSFFSPAALAHTGYAADGFRYAAGVQNPAQRASWATEGSSATRGTGTSFPQPSVVLLSTASLAILDESSSSMAMWMLFYLGDQLALPNNYLQTTAGYTPNSVTWANGLLSVIHTPDPGSTGQSALMVTLDFVRDRVFLDTCV